MRLASVSSSALFSPLKRASLRFADPAFTVLLPAAGTTGYKEVMFFCHLTSSSTQ